MGAAAPAAAQIFLAAHPHPEFRVGPLFINAAVPRDLGVVRVNLSWSLTSPAGRTPPPHDDLYLLWPMEIAEPTATGPADLELRPYVEARGLMVLGSGRLTLRSRDRSRIGTTNLGDPLEIGRAHV